MSPILLQLFLIIQFAVAQVIISKNTQVTPRCGSQLISIELNFDPTQLHDGKFFDWIVVGVSGRPECRLKGNGETKYVIEIAVFNDPCLTQIPARNVFQNRIRIGKNPVVILDGDQSVTVKCVYGLPTVETLAMPVISHNFNIDNSEKTESDLGSSTSTDDDSMSQQFVGSFPTQTVPKQMSVTQQIDRVDGFRSLNSEDTLLSLGNGETAQENAWPIVPTMNPATINMFTADRTEAPVQSKSRFFPLFFILGAICLIVLLLLLFLCVYLFIKRGRIDRNSKLLIGNVSRDEGRSAGNRTWWTDGSTEGYSTPKEPEETTNGKTTRKVEPVRSTNKNSKKVNRTDTKHFAVPSIAVSDRDLQNSIARTNSGHVILSKKINSVSPESSVVPLRSNLEEFVSKTFAIGEYNELSSPAYAYTEPFSEREVDVEPLKKKKSRSELRQTDDAVSSYRSITEFVHAAETANSVPSETTENSLKLGLLMDCVLNIRGFGYRKLTEQEIGRWKNLIQKDNDLFQTLLLSRSVSEIEDIFEREQYRNMFSSTKWREIAECIHKALTKKSDVGKSRSQLQLFVGDVHTDW